MSRLLTAIDVARKLAVSRATFARRRHEMEAAGFPPPCPPFIGRWSERQVDDWINRGGSTAPQADPANDHAPSGTNWADKLARRARGCQ